MKALLNFGLLMLLGLAGTAMAQPRPEIGRLAVLADEARLLVLCPNAITQSFPTAGPAQVTWKICWREVAGSNSIANPNGLVIGPVYLQKAPGAPMLQVIYDLRVSEYFVPYHSGSPRYYDLSGFNFQLTGVTAADCPVAVGGAVLSPRVCREIRDRGLLWKDSTGVRRGEEIALWGAINAANYRYIQEYAFRDDGTIIARSGATAQNLPGRELEPHTHNAIWRVDMDLGGTTNAAMRMQHQENILDSAGTATDPMPPLATAQGFRWSPRLHDAIAVSNPALRNSSNTLSTYHLVALPNGGLTQHFESFTQNDLWVTPYNFGQFAARNLPTYVAGAPSVANRDLVLWYKGSVHHHPRSEDGAYGPGGGWKGTALVMWTGFMLMPHDLFDCTPHYGPCP